MELAIHFGVEITEQEIDKNHIRILFSAKPTIMLSGFVNSLKPVSSRKLRGKFSEVMKREL